MSYILQALKNMERPVLQVSQLADAISLLADQIDHDPKLADALHGISSAIEDASNLIDLSCQAIKDHA